ncbi:MAG: TolC family protein [Candidatus Margulisbacteria bacterium]|nr:TolC family protein [Candidatus Margulisiibacteriota bacterium]
MIKKYLLFSLVLLNFCFSLDILTWQQCQQLARENNTDLKIAKAKLVDESNSLKIAELNGSLTVGGSASVKRAGGESAVKNTAGAGVSAQKLIYDGNKSNNLVLAAEERLKSAEYNYQITEANVRLTIRQYFCEALRSQELLELSKTIVERRNQQYELVRLRYNGGLEHRGSFLKAKANLIEAQNNLSQAKRNLQINYDKLLYSLGLEMGTAILVSENINKIVLAKKPNFNEIIDNSLLLKDLISQKLQDEYGVYIAESNYLPTAYINGSLNQNYSFNQDGVYASSSGWSVGGNLSFDLYDGNKKDYELDKAKSQLYQKKINLENKTHYVYLTLQEMWNNLVDSYDNIAVANIFLEASEERSKIASAQYSSGLISFTDWITIEDELIKTRKSKLNSNLDTLIQEAKWINSKGEGFDEK